MEVVCFDLDMTLLEFISGIGIAMGNADEKLKEAADIVTDDLRRTGCLTLLPGLGWYNEACSKAMQALH